MVSIRRVTQPKGLKDGRNGWIENSHLSPTLLEKCGM